MHLAEEKVSGGSFTTHQEFSQSDGIAAADHSETSEVAAWNQEDFRWHPYNLSAENVKTAHSPKSSGSSQESGHLGESAMRMVNAKRSSREKSKPHSRPVCQVSFQQTISANHIVELDYFEKIKHVSCLRLLYPLKKASPLLSSCTI